ncbi:hypothetical protein RFF05_08075 [Bengtsoniella intestinalis]|uniref:hypothetical protein n=1 Tax=Bengtsoniella intestinalis TaxID=3073143 RepID=UPI00391F0128
MNYFFRWIFMSLGILVFGIALIFTWGIEDTTPQEVLTIAIPYQEDIFDINDSTYVAWLSEQIGMTVEFSFLQSNYTDSYIKQILADPNTAYDGIFFTKSTAPTQTELSAYIATGGIVAIDTWIDQESVYLAETLNTFDDYDLRQEITHTDGHIYYMPALDASSVSKSAQTMWVNVDLLEDVGLQLPSTTEDFAQMLAAFADYDGTMAPIMGTSDQSYFFPLYFLMNSFITCDNQNHFLYLEGSEVLFAPSSDNWRAGLQYCNRLFAQGLIPDAVFNYSQDAFLAICNDPDNLVGCFTTDSIASVLSENSPALLSRYLAVSPLDSGYNTPVALVSTPLPSVGGVVLSTSQYQDEVFALMDLMCSEEGYLRGHYGVPDEDWTEAAPEDITVSGDKAVITVTQSVGTTSDTDSAHVIGPYIASETYADMVAWKGYQVNQSAYLDARAYRTYEYYAPEESLPYLQLSTDTVQELDAFVEEAMIAFVTGEWDIDSDEAWQAYLDALATYSVDDLVAQGQLFYTESEETP